MNPVSVVIGFLPFIAFDILSERDFAHAIGWAAAVALALTAFFMAVGGANKGSSVLNGTSLVIFALITVLDFVGGSDLEQWLITWSAALVMVVLGAVILVLLPIRPFTDELARQAVPEQYWSSPTFIRINRVLSAVWGAGLLALGLLSVLVVALVQADVDLAHDHLDLVLNWVIPIAVYIGLIKFTIAYPDRARATSVVSRDDQPAGRSA